jgi:hypothetical protein
VSMCEAMGEQEKAPTAAVVVEHVQFPALTKKQVQPPARLAYAPAGRPQLPTDKAPKERVRQSRAPQGPKIASVGER